MNWLFHSYLFIYSDSSLASLQIYKLLRCFLSFSLPPSLLILLLTLWRISSHFDHDYDCSCFRLVLTALNIFRLRGLRTILVSNLFDLVACWSSPCLIIFGELDGVGAITVLVFYRLYLFAFVLQNCLSYLPGFSEIIFVGFSFIKLFRFVIHSATIVSFVNLIHPFIHFYTFLCV